MSKYGGNNRIDFGVHFNTDKSSLEQVKKALQTRKGVVRWLQTQSFSLQPIVRRRSNGQYHRRYQRH